MLTAGSFWAGPSLAAGRFETYLKSRFYEKSLFNAATKFIADQANCAVPEYRVIRVSFEQFEDARFVKGAPHPDRGTWYEKTRVLFCGRSADVDVTVFANPDKNPPDFVAAPGRAALQKPAPGKAR